MVFPGIFESKVKQIIHAPMAYRAFSTCTSLYELVRRPVRPEIWSRVSYAVKAVAGNATQTEVLMISILSSRPVQEGG